MLKKRFDYGIFGNETKNFSEPMFCVFTGYIGWQSFLVVNSKYY